MKEDKFTIAIFTPTYNRAYILENLYNSLLRQTIKDFYWLIIDDGSTDNTEDMVKGWISDSKIHIEYYKIKNSGKAAAMNFALDIIKGKLFFGVDSDDYLKDDAIEKIIRCYDNLDKDMIGMLAGMQNFRTNEPVTRYKGKKHRGKVKEVYDIKEISGDAALIYKTEIVKKYRFPVFEGEKFVPESYFWDLLDQEGDIYILKEYICMVDYLEDGYTHKIKKVIFENPEGYYAYIEKRIKLDTSFYKIFCDNIRCVSINMVRKQKNFLQGTKPSIFLILEVPLAALYYMVTFYQYEHKR